jgi:hypothetical protein
LTAATAGGDNSAMAWTLQGTYFESCSCEPVCPCIASLALPADLDYCRVVLAFNLTSGDVDGVDVGGTGAALVVNAPKRMAEGGWKVGLYLSDSASDEQRDALTKVFSGQLGGPPATLGPLLGEFLGVETAPIEFHEEGRMHAVKIGDSVDIEIEDLLPWGVEDGQPVQYTNIVHPAGTTLTLAEARRANVNAFGIEYEGHGGFSKSDFAWSG